VNTRRPPILYGAIALAALSLIWSGYAITDLMHSGKFGLSVALAGDIGWITVLWAEANGVTIRGKTWAATLGGWLIAISVALLLVIHGAEESAAQAIAGPFVVLVGKVAWVFALAAMKDPTAPTPGQQAELHTVMRDSAHEAGMLHARAKAKIARIRAEASVTIARDEADFEIGLERLEKRAELHRRTPLVLPANTVREPEQGPGFDEVAEQASTVIGEHEHEQPNTLAVDASTVREQIANKAVNRPNADREQSSVRPNQPTGDSEQPILADVVREQVRRTANNADAIRNVLAIMPAANKGSVAASVRRERRKIEMKGGYG
jgi:hypothetical protein